MIIDLFCIIHNGVSKLIIRRVCYSCLIYILYDQLSTVFFHVSNSTIFDILILVITSVVGLKLCTKTVETLLFVYL